MKILDKKYLLNKKRFNKYFRQKYGLEFPQINAIHKICIV